MYNTWGIREPLSVIELVFYALYVIALFLNLFNILSVRWERAYRFRLSLIAYCIASIPSAVILYLLYDVESFIFPMLDFFGTRWSCA